MNRKLTVIMDLLVTLDLTDEEAASLVTSIQQYRYDNRFKSPVAETGPYSVILVTPLTMMPKIRFIKELRYLKRGLGLAEAKQISETAGSVLFEGVSGEWANDVTYRLRKAGAEVIIR